MGGSVILIARDLHQTLPNHSKSDTSRQAECVPKTIGRLETLEENFTDDQYASAFT